MPYRCKKCGHTNLRNSQFRFGDLLQLLLFQLPIRCRFCRKRYYVLIPTALAIRSEFETRSSKPSAPKPGPKD
jgi:hypothetical protein